MKPIKIIIALIIALALAGWVNLELQKRDNKMKSQTNFLYKMQKELEQYKKNSEKESKKVQIFYDYAVATLDIKKGEIIEIEQVNLKQFDTKQNGAFDDIKKILGKLAFKDIPKGTLIKSSYIGEDTTYKIPNGMRAVNIPITKIEGFNSLIHKHKRLDIVSATRDSEIILENVMVIAINKNELRKTIESITLEIPAYASADLIKAINVGKVHFVIRGKHDTKKVIKPKKKISRNIESKNLPNLPPATPMPEVPQAKSTVELIQSNQKSQVNFDS